MREHKSLWWAALFHFYWVYVASFWWRGGEGAAGVASVRRHQEMPPCRGAPIAAGSKADPPLAKAEPSAMLVAPLW